MTRAKSTASHSGKSKPTPKPKAKLAPSKYRRLLQLASEPSPDTWRHLCPALAKLPVEEAALAIEELLPVLEAWPDELRATICTVEWDAPFFAGRPDPRSAIVRHLRFARIFVDRYGGIRIRDRELHAGDLRGLTRTTKARQLTRVDLSRHGLGDDGAAVLARSKLANLRTLVLEGCGIGEVGAAALAGATYYAQLDELGLGSNRLEGGAVSALLNGRAPRLLGLRSNALGGDGCEAIAEGLSPSTRALHLEQCSIDALAVVHLSRIPHALDQLRLGQNDLGDDGLRLLTAGSLVVRDLAIENDWIGVTGVRALVDASWPLTRLELVDNALNDEAVRWIAEHGPTTLEALLFDDNDITSAGFTALLESPRLPALRELQLSTNRIGALARVTPRLPQLQTLKLAHNRLADSVRVLATIQADQLRELDLSWNAIDIAALQELTGAAWFGGLTKLHVEHNPLGPGVGVLFGDWPIDDLGLSGTRIGDDGVATLAGTGVRPRKLALDDCGLTDRALEALLEAGSLERVEALRIAGNAITDRGARAIIASRAAPRLRDLRVERNRIGDEGAIALARWRQLSNLEIEGNNFGARGQAAVRAMPPGCCP